MRKRSDENSGYVSAFSMECLCWQTLSPWQRMRKFLRKTLSYSRSLLFFLHLAFFAKVKNLRNGSAAMRICMSWTGRPREGLEELFYAALLRSLAGQLFTEIRFLHFSSWSSHSPVCEQKIYCMSSTKHTVYPASWYDWYDYRPCKHWDILQCGYTVWHATNHTVQYIF